MRLDSWKLAVVVSLTAAGVATAATQTGGAGNKPAPKPTAASKPTAAPQQQPKPAPPRPAPAPQPAPRPVVVKVVQPRPTTPPRKPNTNPNQPQPRDVTVNNDYIVTFAEKGKVRLMDEPLAFDEKGQRKKHTADEIKALKGDTPAEQKLVGFKADYSDVKVGDTVKVYLSTFKPNKKKKDAEKSPGKKDEEKAADKKDEKKDDADKKDADKKDADKTETAKTDKDAPAEEETEDGRWISAGILEGKVMKADKATGTSNLRITVRVTTHQTQNLAKNAANPDPNKNNKPQEINPDQKQATLVVIAKRQNNGTDAAAANNNK